MLGYPVLVPMDIAVPIALFLFAALPTYFWCRGLLKGHKGDLKAGILILIVVAMVEVFLGGSSTAGVNAAGVSLFVFGLATLFVGHFAHPACPLKRVTRAMLGLFFLAAGLLGMIMM